ncbi:lysophospholipid acyltransferase family protein [Viridibacterium curvum]|uniref:Lysophospholipid acyltransferase family protein n=1 Tax=Viridibacterium curvum TaxID=1101404 RepID=A0ABP9R0C8_9RHOO
MRFLLQLLCRIHSYLALRFGLFCLGFGCTVWTIAAIPLGLLPRNLARRIGQGGARWGFTLYLWVLRCTGVGLFDLSELDALRTATPMILAPNHPGMLDAVMVLSRLPRAVCITKASLVDSFFMGAGARLAGYVRNDWFLGTSALAIEALKRGEHVLIFPEGTRTERFPINPVRGSIGITAQRSGVPIQTLIIESDTAFLGKGWGWLKRPDMPMRFRIRLGERIEGPHDARQLPALLEASFARQLAGQEGSALHRFLKQSGAAS